MSAAQVDWADLNQVLDVWERAKQAIRDGLDRGTERIHNVADRVVEKMGLPEEWVARLEDSILTEWDEDVRGHERKFLEQEDASWYGGLR